LLERSALSVPKAIERIGGLQTQYAPSAYLGLWSRLRSFERAALTGALERRSVIQGTLLRMTIHMVSAGDYWPFVQAIRRARRAWWLGATSRRAVEREVIAAAERTRTLLADGPRSRNELVAELGVDSTTWSGVGLWVDLVRVPPSGTWEKRSANLYGLADGWVEPSTATEDDGREHIVSRYLGGFGPASPKDIASWAGLPLTTLAPALARMRLRRFRDEAGTELLDLPRAPLPDPDLPAPVRYLPTWDATLLTHARRTQILPERFRPRIFSTKTPHSAPTFLVDGQVAGTWRVEADAIRITPFERPSRGTERELEEGAERLAAFHGATRVAWIAPSTRSGTSETGPELNRST
jgi:DNA glycosylase AlkZ-like